jgi:hypothetical protein
MRFLLPGFAGGQLLGLLAGVGGQRLLALQGGFDLLQDLAAGSANRPEIVQIARQLIGIVAVEEQSQRVRSASEILSVEQLSQLCLLCAQLLFECARLRAEVPERCLQAIDLGGQLQQVALGGRDRALGILQLIHRVPARSFGGGHLPAQRFDLQT